MFGKHAHMLVIPKLKRLLFAKPQAGRPWVFKSFHALQLSSFFADDPWIREVRCCRSRAVRRQID